MLVEDVQFDLPSVVILAIIASSTLAGGLVGGWLVNHRWLQISLFSALLLTSPLWVYIFWPHPAPTLGRCLFLATLAIAVWRWAQTARLSTLRWSRVDAWMAVGVAIFSLALYWRTLAPSVLGADSGEFQFVPYVFGIAHPPGYPLYTLLGGAFSHLPLASPAYLMNLFSAICSAATLGLLYCLITQIFDYGETRPTQECIYIRAGAILGVLMMALSPTWWGQSTVAAVRTMTGLFVILVLWLAIRWWNTRQWIWLAASGAAFTFGITHHASLVAAGLGLAMLIVVGRCWQGLAWKYCWKMVLLALLPVLILLYLPFRSAMGTPFDPSRPTTMGRFLELVLAQGFRGDMFHYGWEDMPQRLDLLGQLMTLNIGRPGLALAAIGLAFLCLVRWQVALLLIITAVVNTVMGITYQAPVIADYLIPAYLVVCVCIGLAVVWVLRLASWLGQRLNVEDGTVPAAMAICLAWLLVAPGLAIFPAMDLSQERGTERVASTALTVVAPDSTILADWFTSTALWYYQFVEQRRPDVLVKYVAPEGETVPWARRATEEVIRRPTYLTNFDPQTAQKLRLAPAGPLAQVYLEPSFEIPAGLPTTGAVLGGQIRLAAYDISKTVLQPGDKLRLAIYWQALDTIKRSYSVFVHLAAADGTVWGQRDGPPVLGRYTTDRWTAGEVVGDQYEILVLPSVPPGDYHIRVGMYETLGPNSWRRLSVAGQGDAVELATVIVEAPESHRPPFQYPIGADFTGGVRLEGVDINDVQAGAVTITTNWRSRTLDSGALHSVVKVTAKDTPWIFLASQPICRWAHLPSRYCLQTYEIPLPNGVAQWNIGVGVHNEEGIPLFILGGWRLPGGQKVNITINRSDIEAVELVNANFGNQAMLRSYGIEPDEVTPGGVVSVTTRWLPLWRIDEDYSLFVHLLDGNGKIVSQRDATPVYGGYPTLRWAVGREVSDTRLLKIPANLAPGDYFFQVGLYPLTTGQRVPVLDQKLAKMGQGDRVLIGPLKVRSP